MKKIVLMTNQILSIVFIVLACSSIKICYSKQEENTLAYNKACTLLMYGVIEISTKNETNTLRHTKFPPSMRPTEISEIEQNSYAEDCIKKSRVVDVIPETDNNFACFQYALEKTIGNIGFEEEISFPGRLFSIFIEDYFEQTKNPQPNDLVIYTYDQNELIMTHFGVVINEQLIESKWGYNPEIRQHALFNIPDKNSNAAWFYTLKKEYKGNKGKKKAIDSIKACLNLQKPNLNTTNESIIDLMCN